MGLPGCGPSPLIASRGDGRKVRHTVEIALWALKHDVRVRTLQDPETFRDLLYAVVTGQLGRPARRSSQEP